MKTFTPDKLPISYVKYDILLSDMGKANRALARYDGMLKNAPNQSSFLAETSIAKLEALISNRIEGSRSTISEVFEHDLENPENIFPEKRDDSKEVVNYLGALRYAWGYLEDKSFNLDILKRLHNILLDSVRGEHKARGSFKTVQNYIGLPGSKLEDATFIPPPPEKTLDYMKEWESFYRSEQPDVLVQMAIIHAQFELIHPFLDGNGRLGRMLIPIFLYEKKVISIPAFYMSAYLEKNIRQYMWLLDQLGKEEDRAKAWNDWISFFLSGVESQAEDDMGKLRQITDLYNSMKERLPKITKSVLSANLLDEMFKKPIFTITSIKKDLSAPSLPAIRNVIRIFEKEEIIEKTKEGSGQRPARYVFTEFRNIMEDMGRLL